VNYVEQEFVQKRRCLRVVICTTLWVLPYSAFCGSLTCADDAAAAEWFAGACFSAPAFPDPYSTAADTDDVYRSSASQMLAAAIPPATDYRQYDEVPQPYADPEPGIAPEVDPFQDYPHLQDQYRPWEGPGYFGRGVDYLLNSRREISAAVVNMGERMDKYFAGQRYAVDENNTYMRVRVSEQWIESARFNPELDLKFRLDLPGTKERYRVILAYDDDNEQTLQERQRPSQTAARPTNQSLFAGMLRTLVDESGRWERKFGAGVKVKFPPDPFVRATTRRRVSLADEWEFTNNSAAEWFYSSGFHLGTEFVFERLLTPFWLFRASTPFDWRREEDTLEYGQKFSLFQDLGAREAIAYEVGLFGTGFSNSQTDVYYFSVDYRRDLYRDWWFINVVPEVAFERENDFSGVSSLTVSFEVFFK